jgi:hypothetical protein
VEALKRAGPDLTRESFTHAAESIRNSDTTHDDLIVLAAR